MCEVVWVGVRGGEQFAWAAFRGRGGWAWVLWGVCGGRGPVPPAAGLLLHDTSHDTVAHPSCAPLFPSVFLCPLGVPLGPTRLLAGLLPGRVGGGGGAPDAGSGPSLREFPHGGPMHALPVRV